MSDKKVVDICTGRRCDGAECRHRVALVFADGNWLPLGVLDAETIVELHREHEVPLHAHFLKK